MSKYAPDGPNVPDVDENACAVCNASLTHALMDAMATEAYVCDIDMLRARPQPDLQDAFDEGFCSLKCKRMYALEQGENQALDERLELMNMVEDLAQTLENLNCKPREFSSHLEEKIKKAERLLAKLREEKV